MTAQGNNGHGVQAPTPEETKAAHAQGAACMTEIQEVLRKHNCQLTTMQMFQGGMPGPLQIIAVPVSNILTPGQLKAERDNFLRLKK